MTVFDDAGYPFAAAPGLTPEFHREHGTGGFDLEHHMQYLNEVHSGNRVTVYPRLVVRSAKRIHYLLFMVNETRGTLAATFECVNSFADLTVRRMPPFPEPISGAIDRMLAEHRALDWVAPTCGVMGA